MLLLVGRNMAAVFPGRPLTLWLDYCNARCVGLPWKLQLAFARGHRRAARSSGERACRNPPEVLDLRSHRSAEEGGSWSPAQREGARLGMTALGFEVHATPAWYPFFLPAGLSEVYQVSRRLAHGMRAQRVASDRLQQALREVDLAWNNLLSFLALGPATFQRLVRRTGRRNGAGKG